MALEVVYVARDNTLASTQEGRLFAAFINTAGVASQQGTTVYVANMPGTGGVTKPTVTVGVTGASATIIVTGSGNNDFFTLYYWTYINQI
jgi:hypothetical protein